MRRSLSLAVIASCGLIAVIAASPAPLVTAQDAIPTADCPGTTEEENEAIARRWHEDVINGANLDTLDEIVADDIIHHAGTFPDGVGMEAVKTVLGALLAGFPDVQHTIEQVLTDGEFVVTRWQADGTQTGEFQGHAATGRSVTWTGINIFRIECGRIAEEWSELDGLGRLQQVGVLATPTP